MLSGAATARLLPFNNQYLLCASEELCLSGILILMPEKMYENKIQDIISKEGCANARIIGTLSELPWEWKDRIERSLLKKINPNIYGLPRVVLKVNEIKKIGTSKPFIAQAWT